MGVKRAASWFAGGSVLIVAAYVTIFKDGGELVWDGLELVSKNDRPAVSQPSSKDSLEALRLKLAILQAAERAKAERRSEWSDDFSSQAGTFSSQDNNAHNGANRTLASENVYTAPTNDSDSESGYDHRKAGLLDIDLDPANADEHPAPRSKTITNLNGVKLR